MKNYNKANGYLIVAVFFAFTSCTKTEIPQVSTSQVVNITVISAESGGTILSDGGEDIISCGICWGTAYYPTVSDSVSIETSSLGEFSSVMNSLNPGKTYHVRAYATNINGTGYGEDIAFSTSSLSKLPFCIALQPVLGYYCTVTLRGYIYAGSSDAKVSFEIDGEGYDASDNIFSSDVLIYIEEGFMLSEGDHRFRIKVENDSGVAYSDEIGFYVVYYEYWPDPYIVK
jgi:hypothetical protein